MAFRTPGTADLPGLSSIDVPALRKQYGSNIFRSTVSHRMLRILWDIVREPMFILLAVACILYFILDSDAEGFMMAAAILVVVMISIFQETRSARALHSLKQYTEPKVKVIRDNVERVIQVWELVPGDIIMLEEGLKVPADAEIIQSNDLTVDESIITGESLAVDKTALPGQNFLYHGATLNSGKCIARVTRTGNATVLGRIGKSIEGYSANKTVLQVDVNRFVKRLALFGLAGFVIIFAINYFHYREWTTSLLFALTLAMSAVPEEIPVAYSSFMALGAYKMSTLGIISRQPQVIENLGAINVICLDKTGTITENKMQVKTLYHYNNDSISDFDPTLPKNDPVLFYAMLASETNPFDPMEKAIWQAYLLNSGIGEQQMDMIHEYPLQGSPPMMTHVYRIKHQVIVAAKGGAERILHVCRLPGEKKDKILGLVHQLSSKGYRVLGVANAMHTEHTFPLLQDEFNWQFTGLISLHDPPKKNAQGMLKEIYEARIDVKMVTGDHPGTAVNIAEQTGIHPLKFITGDEVMKIDEADLQAIAGSTAVYARMYPDAKLKLVKALKANGDIVAMTGDGVNDGPALKAADIGIAMGKKGTETARRAADLVLTDDDLGKIILAIRQGRKIFSNLVKAIRYIISIHIPIILTASLPLILGWKYPNIFSPLHVIFLELIMAPTCSIFFEKEPVELNAMQNGPRDRTKGLFTTSELIIAIIQGLVITATVLILYYVFMQKSSTIEETRTIVFTTLILSNVFLTFTNRSITKTIFYTIRYKNILAPFIIVISAGFLYLLHFSSPVRTLFQLAPISPKVFWTCFAMAFLGVMWFEIYKLIRTKK